MHTIANVRDTSIVLIDHRQLVRGYPEPPSTCFELRKDDSTAQRINKTAHSAWLALAGYATSNPSLACSLGLECAAYSSTARRRLAPIMQWLNMIVA